MPAISSIKSFGADTMTDWMRASATAVTAVAFLMRSFELLPAAPPPALAIIRAKNPPPPPPPPPKRVGAWAPPPEVLLGKMLPISAATSVGLAYFKWNRSEERRVGK